jgi:hypothetical protein
MDEKYHVSPPASVSSLDILIKNVVSLQSGALPSPIQFYYHPEPAISSVPTWLQQCIPSPRFNPRMHNDRGTLTPKQLFPSAMTKEINSKVSMGATNKRK